MTNPQDMIEEVLEKAGISKATATLLSLGIVMAGKEIIENITKDSDKKE